MKLTHREESTGARITRQTQEAFHELLKGKPATVKVTVLLSFIGPAITILAMLAAFSHRDGAAEARAVEMERRIEELSVDVREPALRREVANLSRTINAQSDAMAQVIRDFTAALNRVDGAIGSIRGDVTEVSLRLDMFKESVDSDRVRMESEWRVVRNRQDTIRKALARFDAFHERAPGG